MLDEEVSGLTGCGQLEQSNEMDRLGKTVYNSEYSAITLGRGQTGHVDQSYVRPGSARRCDDFPRGQTVQADTILCVGLHIGPPETLLSRDRVLQ